ncbi:hypothetical protein V5T82_12990 [Magnetovibrio sp. PR-2]|uniref:hypothetical protein n=1 Tax=Magnetovibrio sp. PR-2 TaxID=3120356 RepID=UPI002FCE6394
MSIVAWASPSLAKDDSKDFSYKVLGQTIPTYEGRLDRDKVDASRKTRSRPGVFKGNYVGCKKREDILAYNQAKTDDDRKLMSKIKTRGRCVLLSGRSYRPVIVGYDTSAVILTKDRSGTLTWVMTLALVVAPPPSRPAFFQYDD